MDVMALLLADSRFPGGGHAHSGGLEEAAARGLIRTEDDLPSFLRVRLRTAGALAAVFAAASAHRATHGVTDWSTLDAELDARTPSAAQRAASRAQGKATARAATTMAAHRAEGALQQAQRTEGVLRHSGRAEGALGQAERAEGVLRHAERVEGVLQRNGGPPAASVPPAGSQPSLGEIVGPLLAATPRPHHPVILGALVGAGGGSPAAAALAAAYLAVSGPASASVRLLGLDPLRVNAIVAALAGEVAAVARDAAATAHLDPADLPAPGSPGLDLLAEEHDRHHREEVRLFVS